MLRDHGIRDDLAPLPGLRTLYFGLRKDLVHRNSTADDRNSLRWRERQVNRLLFLLFKGLESKPLWVIIFTQPAYELEWK